MPLFDSAVLVAAKEIGFAAREGVDLTLIRETSWANIRDRIAIGHFDVAHMLGPMPIACNLGLTPLASDTIVPFSLGLGGNCVTVSNALWAGMEAHGALPDLDPSTRRRGPEALIEERARRRARTAALRGRASAFRPQLRTALLARRLRHRSDARHRDRHRAAALHGRRTRRRQHRRLLRRRALEQRRGVAGIGHIATVKATIWQLEPGEGRRRAQGLGRERTRRRLRPCCARCITPRAGARMPQTATNWRRCWRSLPISACPRDADAGPDRTILAGRRRGT